MFYLKLLNNFKNIKTNFLELIRKVYGGKR